MIFQFTLQEAMTFLVCALGILAGLLAIPILLNLKKIAGILRPLVENNQDFIKKAVKRMPEIFEDMAQIGGNVREATDKLKVSLPAIVQEVESVTASAKGSIELAGNVMEKMGSGINETVSAYKKDSTGYFHIFEELMQLIYRSLTSGK